MQFQADISGVPVFRPSTQEATAAGAAYLAGLAVGFFSGRDHLVSISRDGVTFVPGMPEEKRKQLLDGWHAAVGAARNVSN